MFFAANGHVECANALRFDPAVVSICLAAKHGDWLVTKALLVQGVSINTIRRHISTKGNGREKSELYTLLELVFLLSAGIHHELYTPLIAAAAHGQTEAVRHMCDMPELKTDITNLIGQTALMYAAARGDETSVLKLLATGADRWIKDLAGE